MSAAARWLDAGQSALVGRARRIESRSGLQREAFEREFLEGAGKPVVVTDAMDAWPARSGWTFDTFRQRFGDDPVTANSPFFHDELPGLTPVQLRTTLADYLDYVRDPGQPPRGTWTQGSWEALQANGVPLYAPGYRVFVLHPELEAELPPSPYFVEDLFRALPPHLRRLLDRLESPVHYLFFAPPGAVAFLHHDYWDTHAYLAQLAGRKLAVLFSPEDAPRLAGIKDPIHQEVPADVTPWVGELRAGDLLFMPSRWLHFVVTLEPSLTFSYDFFTRHNMGSYLSHFFSALARFITGEPGPAALAQARLLLRQMLEEAGTAEGGGPRRA